MVQYTAKFCSDEFFVHFLPVIFVKNIWQITLNNSVELTKEAPDDTSSALQTVCYDGNLCNTTFN